MTDDPTGAIPDAGWKPLRILTFYRLILAGLLAALFFALRVDNPLNADNPKLFGDTLLAYLALSLVAGFSARLRWPSFQWQTVAQVLVDVGAITLLMHASGGINSGLSILLIVAIIYGALLLPGRYALFFAAVATLSVLLESTYDLLTLGKPEIAVVAEAGLLGMVLFATAGLAYGLSRRVRESEALARLRGIDVADLEQLNQHIIQHLDSGVLIVDHQGRIRLANRKARKLLAVTKDPLQKLDQASPALHQQLTYWLTDNSWQPDVIQGARESQSVIPRFSSLSTSKGLGVMVFLDDPSTVARQSQQLKLASLGRLSASIAHEIRNPLGAISHAAQLLKESEGLSTADQRLTEIINSHCQRVNAIIENVLQISRRKQAQPCAIDLATWLARFMEEFGEAQRIPAEQLTLEAGRLATVVQCDPGLLHQVLWNLCVNGVKHGGQPPRLTLRLHESEAHLVSLDVIDNGEGVPEDKVNQIFEPFFTTGSGGTGLGLYLARELCELNHCQLAYHPESAQGGCFRIHFSPSAAPDDKAA